jgi:hypothetical protein
MQLEIENKLNISFGSNKLIACMHAIPPLIQGLLKQALLIVPCLFIISCSEPKEPPELNAIEKIELTNGESLARFAMPVSYKAERATKELMLFRLKYPSMAPTGPDRIPQADEIGVWVHLFERRGSTESMVAEALDEFNPERPGHEYHAGTEGAYELYRAFVGRGESQVEVTYYVFKAKDGSLVGVEDPGSWSGSYEVLRKIAPDLQITYLIAKPVGRDFIEIDEAVTSFINQHLEPTK